MSRAGRSGNVHIGRFVEELRATFLLHALALGLSIAGAWAIVKVFADDLQAREGLLAGALIFIILEWFVLYSVVRSIGDQVDEMASRTGPCELIAGPKHAKMTRRNGAWESEGVVWLGVACETGSRLNLTLKGPPGASLRWTAREHMPHLWKKDGVSEDGVELWSVVVERTEARVTPLGQFTIVADSMSPSTMEAVLLDALGASSGGAAVSATLRVGLIVGLDAEQFNPVA
jgi:hypothetical protein